MLWGYEKWERISKSFLYQIENLEIHPFSHNQKRPVGWSIGSHIFKYFISDFENEIDNANKVCFIQYEIIFLEMRFTEFEIALVQIHVEKIWCGYSLTEGLIDEVLFDLSLVYCTLSRWKQIKYNGPCQWAMTIWWPSKLSITRDYFLLENSSYEFIAGLTVTMIWFCKGENVWSEYILTGADMM